MSGGIHYFWLGASADADPATHEPSQGLGPSGGYPLRWFSIEVGESGRAFFSHAHPKQCDCPICKEFDSGFEEGFKEGLQDARARVRKALA